MIKSSDFWNKPLVMLDLSSGILSHIALENHVRQGGAESRVTHVDVDRNNVGGRGLYSHSSLD